MTVPLPPHQSESIQPPSERQQPPIRIAVIGSGLAGLSISHLLSKSTFLNDQDAQHQQKKPFEVHIFERAPSLGMDSASIPIPCFCDACDSDGELSRRHGVDQSQNREHVEFRMDVPMRSFFPEYYPLLKSLYDSINIPYISSDNSMSFFTRKASTDPSTSKSYQIPPSFPTRLKFNENKIDGVNADESKTIPSSAYFSFTCNKIPFFDRRFSLPDFIPSSSASTISSIYRSFLVTRDYLHLLSYSVYALRNNYYQLARSGKGPLAALSMKGFLDKMRYSREFVDDAFLVLFSGVCTCSFETLDRFPAFVILEYFATCMPYGRMSFVSCGMDKVSNRLSEPVDKIHFNTTVVSIQPRDSVVGRKWNVLTKSTLDADSKRTDCDPVALVPEGFDHVVFATQANQCVGIIKSGNDGKDLDTSYLKWRDGVCRVLERFPYERALVVCHTDGGLMPMDRRYWRCLNFGTVGRGIDSDTVDRSKERERETKKDVLKNGVNGVYMEKEKGYNPDDVTMCTHFAQMTHPEVDIPGDSATYPALFQTTNPIVLPLASKTLSAAWFERAVVNFESVRAVEDLDSVWQGQGGVWFVGSYVGRGIPLLEGCLESAERVLVGVCKAVEKEMGRGVVAYRPWVLEMEEKLNLKKVSVGDCEVWLWGAGGVAVEDDVGLEEEENHKRPLYEKDQERLQTKSIVRVNQLLKPLGRILVITLLIEIDQNENSVRFADVGLLVDVLRFCEEVVVATRVSNTIVIGRRIKHQLGGRHSLPCPLIQVVPNQQLGSGRFQGSAGYVVHFIERKGGVEVAEAYTSGVGSSIGDGEQSASITKFLFLNLFQSENSKSEIKFTKTVRC
ncbi:hypothetical protein HDU76_003745 [Blyttiomyces sp. JEL0837]|nr:hypothetical protein HDU76_003745 [Blyttiomyces sp. JEL0837]